MTGSKVRKQTVAMLGLGNMGMGMARRLLAGGYALTVYNRSRPRAESLAQEGARIVARPRAAAEGAEVIISMLADDEASRATWLGEDGALTGASPGTVLIESSTLSLPWVTELARRAVDRGCRFLEAPVTGSKIQAESGELLFLVGGETQALERAREIFACMGRGLIHLGPNGCGALMKLINNFLGAVHAAALAEALALIENSALDSTTALEILANGAPGSPMLRTLAPRMARRDYTPRFALRWMAKDLQYVLEEAERRGVGLRLAQTSLGLFRDAMAEGWAEEDLSAVIEPLRRRAATKAGGE